MFTLSLMAEKEELIFLKKSKSKVGKYVQIVNNTPSYLKCVIGDKKPFIVLPYSASLFKKEPKKTYSWDCEVTTDAKIEKQAEKRLEEFYYMVEHRGGNRTGDSSGNARTAGISDD